MTTQNVSIQAYYDEHQWLLSLITDPAGERHRSPKTLDEYNQQFVEQIARMQAFLDFAGNPERQFKSIHIAGTSGKGSVTTMVAAMLSAAGHRTGDHISPYLQLPLEKLRIDGRMISPSRFAQLIADFREMHTEWVKQGNMLKYGEAWVALTFLYFAQEKVDWGVIETGMGGRYDPTNVIPSEIAIITNVDYDHVHSLGGTIENIARHKAGIIKPNGRVVTATTKPAVRSILIEEAREKKADFYNMWEMEDEPDGTLKVKAFNNIFCNINVPMAGQHQRVNGALAMVAVDWLAHDFGFEFDGSMVQAGLDRLEHPGRFEIMEQNPTIIIDGAHNPHKTQSLVKTFQEMYPGRKATVLVGVIMGKSAEEIIEALLPITDNFLVSEPQVYGKPSQSIEAVMEMIAALGDVPAVPSPNLHGAINEWERGAAADDILLITGSIYLIGQARDRWHPSAIILQQLENNG